MELLKAYGCHHAVSSVAVILPKNAMVGENNHCNKILLSDIPKAKSTFLRRLHFVYRSFINPIRFFFWLQSQPDSVVIFNDFDQLTSFVWAPLLKRLKARHLFCVILHDPDRDSYFPSKVLSIASMKKVMSIMDIAFFHGYLPDKKYYDNKVLKVEIPHGVYGNIEIDSNFRNHLLSELGHRKLLGILGNIRDEKNYKLVFNILHDLPGYSLLIAGSPASSTVPIEEYKAIIDKKGLKGRVIWIQRFLDEQELNAAIQCCEIVLLYYKPSFTSQSGILNKIAPFAKKIVVSDVPSSLAYTVKKYRIGFVARPQSESDLIRVIQLSETVDSNDLSKAWDEYKEEASWSKHVEIAINAIQSFQ